MNRKQIISILMVMFMLFSLTSCKHNCKKKGHVLSGGSCTTAKVCEECGESIGDPLGHSWQEATTTAPKTCSVCGLTEGNPLPTGLQAELPQSTSTKVTLPTTFEGKNVTWESLSKDVMLDDGTIVVQETSKKVTLVATLTDPTTGEVTTQNCQVLVNATTVNSGPYEYAYKYYMNKLKGALSKNVTLITRDYNGCSVKYESLDESVITSTGVITKTTVEQKAMMNIWIIKDGIAILYPTEVTVDDYNNLERIAFAEAELNSLVEKFQMGQIDTLPLRSETYDVDYHFVADNPEFLVLSDRILTPVTKSDVTLKITLSRAQESLDKDGNAVYDTKELKYHVTNVGGTITMEEYLNAWLPTILPTEIVAHKNEVTDPDPVYDNQQFFKRQYQVNTGGVLNLIDGHPLVINRDLIVDVDTATVNEWGGKYSGVYYENHPDISKVGSASDLQAVYDHFYEGYTIPNEENILWIVVHESGMPTVGSNAKLLAQIQYDRAYGNRSYAAASWNYQVDEGVIYQSYEDEIYCWHAGGDYGKWLPFRNSNSIGIEMCINLDGNYDGSLVHDTKLVAYLMQKYNLTMSNVVRHHDTSGKDCPAYMLATNRWVEFQKRVVDEWLAIKFLQDAEVTWTVSNPELFNVGPNNIWYAKGVSADTDIQITLNVVKGSYTYNKTVTVTLHPDTAGV